MRPRVLIAVTVLVSALALSAMTRASAQSGDTAKGDRPASRRPVIGQVEMLPDAPDFELKSIDGKTVHLSDYRGKAVLLNFWATWCVPCKEEMPWLVAFQKQYAPKGLVILGIAMDASAEPVREFTKRVAVDYQVLFGNQRTPDRFYVKRVSASVFFYLKGRITHPIFGGAPRKLIVDQKH